MILAGFVGPLPLHAKPTRIRYLVLTYLCVLAFILYLDRACIGQAAPRIKEDLGLTQTQLGQVQAAFTLGYGLFMVIAGRIGDRFGSRIVLVVLVVWWSTFTSLTALANGLVTLLVVRFIFGMGEAGALPNTASILSRWFPVQASGLPQGLINTTALLGAATAHIAAALTMELFDHQLQPFFLREFGTAPIGWRWMFIVFGSLGILWAIAFWCFYRDDPAADSRVNLAERHYILAGRSSEVKSHVHEGVPLKKVLQSVNIWLLGFIITCASFGSYLYISWYPTYLQAGRGVEPVDSGAMSSMVLAGGALGSAFGGIVGDFLLRRTGRRRIRSAIGSFAMTISGILLLVSIVFDSPFITSLFIAAAYFTMMSMISSWWGAVNDISGQHVGTLFGLVNSMGIVGGISAQIFPGWVADANAKLGLSGRPQWDPILFYLAGILFIGALAWSLVNSNRSAVE